MKKIVLFASGSGSNAEKIITHCNETNHKYTVEVFTNNVNAKVIEKVKKLNVPTLVFSKIELENGYVLNKLMEFQPDLIVLAGFLLKFPVSIIEKFENKIINIHPSLLPKYGGKGMYGINVHQAVFDNKELESGITIHYVNENYDEGTYIFQKSVNVENCETADEIAAKVLHLEHTFFPKVVEKLLT